MPRQLSLNLFIYTGGHHEAAWRYKDSHSDRIMDIRFYQDLARRAEAAKMDAIFLADSPAMPDNIRHASRFYMEPVTWLSSIAAATTHIGLIATATTTYTEPYNLARQFATLDHVSRGRAGWNIVTTTLAAAAKNFGMASHPPHADRYERAREYMDVVTRLWDSWEDDAMVVDKASGIFTENSKIHAIDHVGRHFQVAGPLNAPRPPQGRPVYVQAGASDDGRAFAARYAEAIFTAHQTLANAQEFYADIKRRAGGFGRNPEHVRILPGLSPMIGSTEAEAKRLKDDLDDLIMPDYSLDQLRRMVGVDLSAHDLDGPFPRHLVNFDTDIGISSRFKLVMDIVDRENPTIRQLIQRLAGGRGHNVVAGTPEQIADTMQAWADSGAADGFNVMPPYFPGGFELFADHVIPILRKRGLFRAEYSGSTLRDHFGLPRPDSIYAHRMRESA